MWCQDYFWRWRSTNITDSPFIDSCDASPLYGCVVAVEVVHTDSILQFFGKVRSGIRLKLCKYRSEQLILRDFTPSVLGLQRFPGLPRNLHCPATQEPVYKLRLGQQSLRKCLGVAHILRRGGKHTSLWS
jgi:hypothetical protein